MPSWPSVAADLVAITILSFAIYFPRYRRQDLLLSYIVLNVGVLGVTIALTSAAVGVGVGFGLFGVLSIVRLRSAELEQQEVAYYFAALVLGLLGGIAIEPTWVSPAVSVALLFALYVVDHPRMHPRYRNQVMTLDCAFTNERELMAFLESTLEATVSHVLVKRVDLVSDTTVVDVRFRLPREVPAGAGSDREPVFHPDGARP